MFGGGPANPYDEIVAKATDENLTSENWEIILTLCDKIADEGKDGASSAVQAVIKRLAHRNPNVQLYSLSLAEAMLKNLGIELHRELASKAFTQALEKIITDRTTHEKVKRRALQLVAECTAEFEGKDELGIMEDLYNSLKAKNYKVELAPEPLPPAVDDDIRRKEEEELQRVLEMSMQDRGGRAPWADYSLASSGAGSSSAAASSSSTAKPATTTTSSYSAPKYQAGYVPARTPSPRTQQRYQQPDPEPTPQHHRQSWTSSTPNIATESAPTTSASPPPAANLNIVTRVRALHTFEPTEPGELAFEKGDIIKVVDRGYKDWWRGQLKGRTGIFPVNYVEPMPEPTAAELAREAEQEAAVFAQAVNVERLLNMLRSMDPDRDNLADNEEIQELYRSCMTLRPKIVKLIDKYSQKRADLVSMNETFIRARTIFDRMMEESLARHTGVYDQQQAYRPSQYPGAPQGRPGPAGRPPGTPGPQGYGWNVPGFEQPPYGGYQGPASSYPVPQPQVAPPVAATPAPQAYVPPPQAQPAQAPYVQPAQAQPAQVPYVPPQAQPPVQVAPTPAPAPQPQAYGYNAPYSVQGPNPYGQVPSQMAPHPHAQQPAPVQQAAQPAPQPQPRQSFDDLDLPDPYSQPAAPVPSMLQPAKSAVAQSQTSQPLPFAQPQHQQTLPTAQPQAQSTTSLPVLSPTSAVTSSPQGQPNNQGQAAQAFSPQALEQQSPPVQQVQPLQQTQPQPQLQLETAAIEPSHLQRNTSVQSTIPTTEPATHVQSPVQTQFQPLAEQTQPQPVSEQSPSFQPTQQGQPIQQAEPIQQIQPVQQVQPTSAASPAAAASSPPQSGPPYVYDPNATYEDPNVQAWAQYYAAGGTDLAGAVYFISVPGVTGPASPGGAGAGGPQRSQSYQAGAQQGGQQQQQQQQPVQQLQTAPSNATRYQLTDSGFINPNGGAGAQSPKGQASELGYSSEGASGASVSGTSPRPQTTTPSWVLPKKNKP